MVNNSNFGDVVQEQESTAVRARDYLSLLWMVVAAGLGMSLLCGVAAVGINDINNAALIGTPTAGIVNFVISNMNTMIVETVQVFSQPLPSKTLIPSPTNTATITPTGTHVIYKPFPSSTPTYYSPQYGQPTYTSTLKPTATPTLLPTSTPKPTTTHTLTPTNTYTYTPIPDTDTPTPIPDTVTPTYTPIPDTDTPVPTDTPIPDTDTPVPDTDTPVPTATDIPIVP